LFSSLAIGISNLSMLSSRSAFRRRAPTPSGWADCLHDPAAPQCSFSSQTSLHLRYVLDPHDPLFSAPESAARRHLQVRRRRPLVAGYRFIQRDTPALPLSSVKIDLTSDSPLGSQVSTSSRSPSYRNRTSPSPKISIRLAHGQHLSPPSSLHASGSPASIRIPSPRTVLSDKEAWKGAGIELSQPTRAKAVLSRFDDDAHNPPPAQSRIRFAPVPEADQSNASEDSKQRSAVRIHRKHTNPRLMARTNTFGKLSLQNAHETLTIDFKPFLHRPQLRQLQLSVWFRVLQLALLFLMAGLGNLAPVSLMSWWLLALVGVPTVASQVPLFTQVDSVLLRRIVVMFDFHFTFFSSSLFLLGSISRDVLAFDALSSGSDVSITLMVFWRMFGCVSLIFALMRVQCQDALLLDRVEKLCASWLICLSSLCFWLFSRAIVATIDIGLEPSLCTPSGACFTLQRIRLDTLMSSIVFAGNCLRSLVFNADRFCMIKSTISLNVMTKEVDSTKKAAKSFSFSSKSLLRTRSFKIRGMGSNIFLVTSSSRLIRRFVLPKLDAASSQLASKYIIASSVSSSVSSTETDETVQRLRLTSKFSDVYGSTSFQSQSLVTMSIPHSIWIFWVLATILVIVYLAQEPRSSWFVFAVMVLFYTTMVLMILPRFDRSTLGLLFRNFEWWYFCCLSTFYLVCIIVDATEPEYVSTTRAASGLVDSNGNSTLALQTAALVFWSAILTTFNIFVVSSDAMIAHNRFLKLAFALFNFVLNIVVAVVLCFRRNGLESVSPRLCFGTFCNSLFSLQIQTLFMISLFALKYCLYLWYTPNALLVLRAPITVSQA
jgi:hypothetical protein